MRPYMVILRGAVLQGRVVLVVPCLDRLVVDQSHNHLRLVEIRPVEARVGVLYVYTQGGLGTSGGFAVERSFTEVSYMDVQRGIGTRDSGQHIHKEGVDLMGVCSKWFGRQRGPPPRRPRSSP